MPNPYRAGNGQFASKGGGVGGSRSKGVTYLQSKYKGGVTVGRKTTGATMPFNQIKLGGANPVNVRRMNQSLAANRSGYKNRNVSGNLLRATNVTVGTRSRTGTLSEGIKVYRGRGFGGSSNGKKNAGLVRGSEAYRISSLGNTRKLNSARQSINRNRRSAAAGGIKVKSGGVASKPLQTKLRGSLRVNASAIRTTKPYGPKPAKSSAKVAAGIAGYVGRQQRISNASKRK